MRAIALVLIALGILFVVISIKGNNNIETKFNQNIYEPIGK